MSLFFYNVYRTAEELIPPPLRKPKNIAFARTILTPIRYLSDLFLNEYCKGANYADYDGATAYVKYDRVVWQDYGVYELKVTNSTGVMPTGDTLSSTNWRKILDDFIGYDERVRWNGQLIVFEYAINRRFRVSSAPYIYVESIVVGASQNFIRVFVPLAVYNTLGPSGAARTARVTEFIAKYAMGDKQIIVSTY